ncbi:hypothetical protein BK004_02515 [bacterium CG10_46_32]|nr:MAG: hypothetical protein BK004_02515 [bacterium CG10_46_32]PIR56120.1 MAG: hypothetical protein COU73_02535 [Parcubacteria group bacterium CG10_big_fil_rev_8_21_14_0_10_46_32]
MPRTLYSLLRPLFSITRTLFLRSVEGIENIPKQGPFILAGNHVSIPDQWLMAMLSYTHNGVPVWFVARDDYWWGPWWTKPLRNKLATLLIDWRTPSNILREAEEVLRQNQAIAIYPEGTRNSDSRALALGKTGIARLALTTGVPIIPVGYEGPMITNVWEVFHEFVFKRNTATLRFGKPLTIEARQEPVTREDLYKITDRIMIEIGNVSGKRARLHDFAT